MTNKKLDDILFYSFCVVGTERARENNELTI
jgi:hypothetical protein